jgi:hypothetical protein
MFTWLVKKATGAVREVWQEIEKKLKDACKLGQKAAQNFGTDLDTYAGRRFEEIGASYLKEFKDRLDLAEVADKDSPPLILAKIELNVFWDRVQELKPKLVEEILSAYAEWMKMWAQIGKEAEMKQVVYQKVDYFAFAMREASLKELLDRVARLKSLDKAWRAANPEKSTRFLSPRALLHLE